MQHAHLRQNGLMPVYCADPSTSDDEGAVLGDSISFRVAGITATVSGPDTAQWTSHGDVRQVNLVANSSPPIMTTTRTLASGWNLINPPVTPTVSYKAESLLQDINGQGGNCNEVDRWLNGGWDSHIRGLPFNNFSINIDTDYFVKCAQNSNWSLQGRTMNQPMRINLAAGWNLVTVPYTTAPLTAESMLNEITAQGGNCNEVDRWLNGGWDSHIRGLPFNNFTIQTNQGYFVKCAAASSYTPGGTSR